MGGNKHFKKKSIATQSGNKRTTAHVACRVASNDI